MTSFVVIILWLVVVLLSPLRYKSEKEKFGQLPGVWTIEDAVCIDCIKQPNGKYQTSYRVDTCQNGTEKAKVGNSDVFVAKLNELEDTEVTKGSKHKLYVCFDGIDSDGDCDYSKILRITKEPLLHTLYHKSEKFVCSVCLWSALVAIVLIVLIEGTRIY